MVSSGWRKWMVPRGLGSGASWRFKNGSSGNNNFDRKYSPIDFNFQGSRRRAYWLTKSSPYQSLLSGYSAMRQPVARKRLPPPRSPGRLGIRNPHHSQTWASKQPQNIWRSLQALKNPLAALESIILASCCYRIMAQDSCESHWSGLWAINLSISGRRYCEQPLAADFVRLRWKYICPSQSYRR
jgi:hypothetical protein